MPRKSYTEDDVLDAILDVHDGVSLRKAAQKYGVPLSTYKETIVAGAFDDIQVQLALEKRQNEQLKAQIERLTKKKRRAHPEPQQKVHEPN